MKPLIALAGAILTIVGSGAFCAYLDKISDGVGPAIWMVGVFTGMAIVFFKLMGGEY